MDVQDRHDELMDVLVRIANALEGQLGISEEALKIAMEAQEAAKAAQVKYAEACEKSG